jgi:TPR repeat protein
MYLLGEGVRSDPDEALRWLRLAAAQGEGQAMRLLADLYRDGAHGFPVDPLQAAHWDEQYRVCQETLGKNIEDTD